MDHKENQSPAQERKHNQLAELIRVTWGFAKDFSVNEVSNRHGFQEHVNRSRVTNMWYFILELVLIRIWMWQLGFLILNF